MRLVVPSAFAVVALAFTASPARAKDEPPPREITVSGDADVKAPPDQVILTLAVETDNKDLVAAEAENDARVKRVLEIATKEFRIEPRHVQTDQISIEPRYRQEKSDATPVLMGYWVRKRLVICVKDLAKFQELLNALLRAGTNYVPGVEFQSTELRKYRDQARSMAMRAAKEKATAMAAEVGQKIGRPLSISENGGYYGYYGWQGNANAYAQNVSSSSPSESENSPEGSFAPGQIEVRANVTVRFELE